MSNPIDILSGKRPPQKNQKQAVEKKPAPCPVCGSPYFGSAISTGPLSCMECHPLKRVKQRAMVVREPDGTFALVQHDRELAALDRRRRGEPPEDAQEAASCPWLPRDTETFERWWESLTGPSEAILSLAEIRQRQAKATATRQPAATPAKRRAKSNGGGLFQ